MDVAARRSRSCCSRSPRQRHRRPGLSVLIIVIGFLGWASVGRIVRGQVLSIKEKEYVEAARSLGAGPWRIMFIDILPNVIAPIIVYATPADPG